MENPLLKTVLIYENFAAGVSASWFCQSLAIAPDSNSCCRPPSVKADWDRLRVWAVGQQRRYETWDEALAGHKQFVAIIREGLF
jgi:hypothetical protein